MKLSFTTSQLTHLYKPIDFAKFIYIQKGRRWGFTRAAAQLCIIQIAKKKAKRILWGDVTYNNCNNYIRNYFLPILKQIGNYSWKKTEHILEFNGAEIHFRSAEYPESWEGLGYDLVILNEAGIILKDNYIYKNAVIPMMADNPNSQLIAGGAPKGKTHKGRPHPFFELCERAKADESGKSYHAKVSMYDNPLLDKETIEILKDEIGDPNKIAQEIFGEFVDEIYNRYAWAFDETIHIGEPRRMNGLPVFLSFDFNVNPMTCIAGHIRGKSIEIFKEYRLVNSNVYELCEQLWKEYQGTGMIVTGDATGRARSAAARKGVTNWQIIKQELRLKDTQLKVPSVNPEFDNAYMKLNKSFRDFDILINKKACPYLIKDLELIDYDTFRNAKNSLGDMSHLLDCFKYFCWSFL